MTDYRLFLKDAQGRISQRVDLECPDDTKAIAHAQAFDISHGADLWVDTHRVHEFPPLARKKAA
jgi:hypothetical protein